MAVPPTIPTSFVPKQAVSQNRRRFSAGTGVLSTIALIVLGLSIAAAAGVFGYEYYLKTVSAAKAEELKKAEASISEDTVEEFVRLRDRFSAAEILMNNHIAFSQFFDILEDITLQNVRFTSMSAVVQEDKTVKVEMNGTARNFNALAAQSAAFAGQRHIKRAIFAGIVLNTNNTIGFTLTADLDPRLITMEVGETAVQAPAPAPTEVQFSTTTPAAPVAPAAPSAATTTP